MRIVLAKRLGVWTVAATLAVVGALGTVTLRAAGENAPAPPGPLFTTKLPNVPGKSLTAVVVKYAPGGKSPKHAHAGSVFAYVLSGQIRSQTSVGDPVKVYKTGETFFEPPGAIHLVSENASDTEPASLLAVFIADDGAQLTHLEK